jgi:hypothetical protein
VGLSELEIQASLLAAKLHIGEDLILPHLGILWYRITADLECDFEAEGSTLEALQRLTPKERGPWEAALGYGDGGGDCEDLPSQALERDGRCFGLQEVNLALCMEHGWMPGDYVAIACGAPEWTWDSHSNEGDFYWDAWPVRREWGGTTARDLARMLDEQAEADKRQSERRSALLDMRQRAVSRMRIHVHHRTEGGSYGYDWNEPRNPTHVFTAELYSGLAGYDGEHPCWNEGLLATYTYRTKESCAKARIKAQEGLAEVVARDHPSMLENLETEDMRIALTHEDGRTKPWYLRLLNR